MVYGKVVTVIDKIGEGGQGIVYRVRLDSSGQDLRLSCTSLAIHPAAYGRVRLNCNGYISLCVSKVQSQDVIMATNKFLWKETARRIAICAAVTLKR